MHYSYFSFQVLAVVMLIQGPRSKFLSRGARDERVSQIGVGGGNA